MTDENYTLSPWPLRGTGFTTKTEIVTYDCIERLAVLSKEDVLYMWLNVAEVDGAEIFWLVPITASLEEQLHTVAEHKPGKRVCQEAIDALYYSILDANVGQKVTWALDNSAIVEDATREEILVWLAR